MDFKRLSRITDSETPRTFAAFVKMKQREGLDINFEKKPYSGWELWGNDLNKFLEEARWEGYSISGGYQFSWNGKPLEKDGKPLMEGSGSWRSKKEVSTLYDFIERLADRFELNYERRSDNDLNISCWKKEYFDNAIKLLKERFPDVKIRNLRPTRFKEAAARVSLPEELGDSLKTDSQAEELISQDKIWELYEDGEISVALPKSTNLKDLIKSLKSRIQEMWGDEEVNFAYEPKDFTISRDGSVLNIAIADSVCNFKIK